MAKTPTKLLLILPTFLILTLFFYLSIFHQNKFNFNLLSKLFRPPFDNPSINNIINHTHHPHDHDHDDNISYFTMLVKQEKEKKKKKNNQSSLEKIEDGLARARSSIQEATRTRSCKSEEEEIFVPRGPVYRNPYAFQQSHREMVKRFKIWTYKEGERPLVHQGPMSYFYGIEGHFIQEMEDGTSSINKFMARHPDEAHVFFLPFSIVNMRLSFYKPLDYDRGPINKVSLDYVNVVAQKHPYWNRTHGADHFMLSCHDWAPEISFANPQLLKNLIRALCNANTSEGFQPMRDVPIPEINVPGKDLNQPGLGLRTSKRRILAFFAGGNHGHVRKSLFAQWEKDSEIQLYEHLPKNQNYFQMLGQSKFCLCPSGYEVASSRIVEAIRAECVPVIIKDNYSFPFSDVLDWNRFSIYVPKAKIPEIKTMLKGISPRQYAKLVRGVRSVKWHFTLNRPSKPFDLIHMVLHSIWLRRLNIRLPY
ncbi:probable glycosyltransferase At5g20260 isoform X2 [Spinacia oleracea]|uniref:Probable glycosyltransferase At5g20260 isoform X2 n=1 Tax=Spinacia oleracea TaxID=3562 RepID=A0A9R0J5L4_SPIOL|nr:probable glycosyltransferase At5g20260 isoform X2 [Spinacia oleracea]